MTDDDTRHRHPLPWTQPGRPLTIEGNDDPQRPYRLRAGNLSSVLVTLTRDELTLLADAATSVLNAPARLLIVGGDIAADWMIHPLRQRLGEALTARQSVIIAHQGRPASVDEHVAVWAIEHQVPTLVGPILSSDGADLALLFDSGDGAVNLDLATDLSDRGIPFYLMRGPR